MREVRTSRIKDRVQTRLLRGDIVGARTSGRAPEGGSLVSYMPLAISTNFAKRSALNHEQKFTRWLSVAQ